MNKGDRLTALMATMKEIEDCYRQDDYRALLKTEIDTIGHCVQRMQDMLSDKEEASWIKEMEDLRKSVLEIMNRKNITYGNIGYEIGFTGSTVHSFCTEMRKGRSPRLMKALHKWVADNSDAK